MRKHYSHYSLSVNNSLVPTILLHCLKIEGCCGHFSCLCWLWTCCLQRQKLVKKPEFLFSFWNTSLSVPDPDSPEGNKASSLLFGNSTHPHVNNCTGYSVGFIYVFDDCVDEYTTISNPHPHTLRCKKFHSISH